MNHLIPYKHPGAAFHLFCPVLSQASLGHGSKPTYTSSHCWEVLWAWLFCWRWGGSATGMRAKITQKLAINHRNFTSLVYLITEMGPKCCLFPLPPLAVSSQPYSEKRKKNVEKVQKLLYLLWVWREAERHCIFIWIFSGHLHNFMHLMKLSPVAFTESKSGSGLSQGDVCLVRQLGPQCLPP